MMARNKRVEQSMGLCELVARTAVEPRGTWAGDGVKRIDLKPDYQHNFTWNPMQSGLFIDTLLRDLDSPKIYLVEFPQKYECADGRNRLRAIRNFVEGKSRVFNGFEYTKSFAGLSVREKNWLWHYPFTVVSFVNPSEDWLREALRRVGLKLNPRRYKPDK